MEDTQVNTVERNSKDIRCPHCKTVILLKDAGSLVNDTYLLPARGVDQEPRKMSKWWLVKNMFHFENIGFTHGDKSSASKFRYLTCAECEREPIGLQELGGDHPLFLCADESLAEYVDN